jgi:hypothetical protein
VKRSGVKVHAYSMKVRVAFSLSSCAPTGVAATTATAAMAHAQTLPAHFMIRIS